MEDPNADTEWNNTLRNFNILPPKSDGSNEATITEADVIKLVEETVGEKSASKAFEDMTLEELESFEDEEDERILQEYRRKRIQQMKDEVQKSRFGDLTEITGVDYIKEVNNAGEGIWVVIHLYQHGLPHCKLLNHHLELLARKFPKTKFLKSISTLCVKDYPDRNLPAIFIYYEGHIKKPFVGTSKCGGANVTIESLEWMLHEVGAIKSDMDAPPKKEINDVLFSSLRSTHDENTNANSDDENDW